MVNNGNRLELKAALDFDFEYGACTLLNQKTIVLCFDYTEGNVCRQSSNPLKSFTKLPNSTVRSVSLSAVSLSVLLNFVKVYF